mmetsp:Transcript_11354/g.36338  ORF Transcript_11354/g.36338 Transcript_11354/m.36338 type:complete len:547 (+) Transcript_11354:175-1815(+)
MNDTAHRRGRLAAWVSAPRDQQQDKSQGSAERSLGACCARGHRPLPISMVSKIYFMSFWHLSLLASFCILHAHRVACRAHVCASRACRVCVMRGCVSRNAAWEYVSTSSHQTHNSETDDRHTRPQCIALNCNTIRKSVTISVCASASPATSRARSSECAPIITRRRGCQCAFRLHTPASDHWPLFGRRPEPAQLPLLAALERAHRRLQLGRRAARLGAHGRPRLALAEERRPRRLRLCPRRLALEHLLAAQVVRDDEATRVHRPVRGVPHRIGDREEGEGQVGRAECVAQRHVRVAAIPVLRPPLRRPPLLDEPRHVRRRREPAAQVSAHHRQGPDHEWEGAVHAPLLRAAVPPRVRRADRPRRPAAVPPLLCHERVVLEVASVHARQARRRPEEGGEPRDVDERVVVRLCVEGGARVGDRRVAEPREQLVDARVDAARLVEVGRVDDGKVVLPDAPPLFVELLHVARREAALAHDEANQRRGADLGCWHEHGLADPLARLWRTRIGHEAEDQKRGRRLLSRRVGRASPPPPLTVETVEHPAALAQ